MIAVWVPDLLVLSFGRQNHANLPIMNVGYRVRPGMNSVHRSLVRSVLFVLRRVFVCPSFVVVRRVLVVLLVVCSSLFVSAVCSSIFGVRRAFFFLRCCSPPCVLRVCSSPCVLRCSLFVVCSSLRLLCFRCVFGVSCSSLFVLRSSLRVLHSFCLCLSFCVRRCVFCVFAFRYL